MSSQIWGEDMARKKKEETKIEETATVGISTEAKKEEPRPVKKPTPEAKVNAGTYCSVRKYPRSIASRLGIFLLKSNDEKKEKTMQEWDKVYDKAMNRVTN